MSILDINKAMAMYSQPTEFDQNAWKTAFDIANNFAATSENHRKNRENLATENWRVAFQNNDYQTGIEKNNLAVKDLQRLYNNALQTDPSQIASTIAQNTYSTTNNNLNTQKLQGQDQLVQAEVKYRYDPLGRMRSDEEVYNLALQNGDLKSPYATVGANQNLKQFYTNMSGMLAPFNTEAAATYGYQAGLPYMVDSQGNLTIADTGQPIAQNLSLQQMQAIYNPAMTKSQELTWQQKQDVEQQQRYQFSIAGDFGEAIKNATQDGTLNQDLFRASVQNIYRKYPQQYWRMIDAQINSIHQNQQPTQTTLPVIK